MPEFPARLHVLLAANAALAVVVRRGPSKHVATVLWDRRRDEFHLGQWLKGRIYERRSDLSPDGKHLVYFAVNGHWGSEAKGAWTAISSAPYLKALALFPKGDCWHGGGLWTGDRRYWLNDGCGHDVLRDSRAFVRDRSHVPAGAVGGECLGVYFPRLIRDGWTMGETVSGDRWSESTRFEKPLGKGWTLRKTAHGALDHPVGTGCYWDEHLLVHEDGRTIDGSKWEWADLDGRRLVWATSGKLFAANVQRGGLVDETELYDFNAMTFEPIEAPY